MVVALRLVMAAVVGIACYVLGTRFLPQLDLDSGWYWLLVMAGVVVGLTIGALIGHLLGKAVTKLGRRLDPFAGLYNQKVVSKRVQLCELEVHSRLSLPKILPVISAETTLREAVWRRQSTVLKKSRKHSQNLMCRLQHYPRSPCVLF